jgi:hypothetical protein
MKTTPFVVAIALLAHGALAADLDETAKAREHFAESYRNVIDQAVVYDQLRRDELADLEVHLDVRSTRIVLMSIRQFCNNCSDNVTIS